MGNSKGRLQVKIYEIGASKSYSMGELSGQTNAVFDLDRDSYFSNQTVCMGYSKSSQKWYTDLCQSQLIVEDVQMKCTCNAFDSNKIGVFTDLTRVLGKSVTFPAIILPESDVQQFTVVPSNVDHSLLNENIGQKITDDNVVSQIKNVNGTNYVWIG